MKQPFLRHALLLFLVPLTLVAVPVGARPHQPSQKHRPVASKHRPVVSPAQVDGIVGGVVDQLWQQTDRYWHVGDYPRIIGLDRIITQADPQFLEAYATGGWLMESLGRMQDAEVFYTRGTVQNPHAAYAYWNLGFFLFNTMHNYPAAACVFQNDTRQVDADLNDWKMLGHAQEKAGEWDQAVATWRAVKARWPNGMSVDRLLAEAEEKRRQAQADGKAGGVLERKPNP